MGISRTEAASALTDVESTAGRSRLLKGYHVAGPILMVWGVIWALGYSSMGLLPPEQWGLVWLVLDVVGVVATILLSRPAKSVARSAAQSHGWKIIAGVLAILFFYAATLTLFHPTSIDATIAYPGVVTGLVYAGMGIAFAPRYLWIGAAVFAASLVGYFFFQPWLAFWMAAVGGGGLFVAGLWLRRA
uniref:Transmembrane protein n=1 Tax=Caulobacter sp. (strain K31) TaxID=366602 RepID=B0T1V4_CAUSK